MSLFPGKVSQNERVIRLGGLTDEELVGSFGRRNFDDLLENALYPLAKTVHTLGTSPLCFKPVKSTSAVILALLTCGLASVGHMDAADEVTGPSERSLERYTHIWTAKPFVAATVVTPQAESLAQRYAITGYGSFGGNDVIFILDRVSLSRFTITDQREENGVALLDVTEKDDANRLKARIRIGGEVAELAYDPGTAGMVMGGGENPALTANMQHIAPAANMGAMAQTMTPNPPQVVPPKRSGAAPRPVRVIQKRNAIQSQ